MSLLRLTPEQSRCRHPAMTFTGSNQAQTRLTCTVCRQALMLIYHSLPESRIAEALARRRRSLAGDPSPRVFTGPVTYSGLETSRLEPHRGRTRLGPRSQSTRSLRPSSSPAATARPDIQHLHYPNVGSHRLPPDLGSASANASFESLPQEVESDHRSSVASDDAYHLGFSRREEELVLAWREGARAHLDLGRSALEQNDLFKEDLWPSRTPGTSSSQPQNVGPQPSWNGECSWNLCIQCNLKPSWNGEREDYCSTACRDADAAYQVWNSNRRAWNRE